MEFGLYKWRPGSRPAGGARGADGAAQAPAVFPAAVDRVLKEGAKVLQRYYAELPDTVAGVLAVAKSMVFGEAGEGAAAVANGAAAAAASGSGSKAAPLLRQRQGAGVAMAPA